MKNREKYENIFNKNSYKTSEFISFLKDMNVNVVLNSNPDNSTIERIKKLIKMNNIEKYENICNEIIKDFEDKQDLSFNFWITDTIGSVASFGHYFFNFEDIVFDIKTNQPKDLITNWQEDHVEFNMNKKPKQIVNINYKDYTMGFRYNNFKQKK